MNCVSWWGKRRLRGLVTSPEPESEGSGWTACPGGGREGCADNQLTLVWMCWAHQHSAAGQSSSRSQRHLVQHLLESTSQTTILNQNQSNILPERDLLTFFGQGSDFWGKIGEELSCVPTTMVSYSAEIKILRLSMRVLIVHSFYLGKVPEPCYHKFIWLTQLIYFIFNIFLHYATYLTLF